MNGCGVALFHDSWGWEFDGVGGGSARGYRYSSRYGLGEWVALGSFMSGGVEVDWFCVLYSSLLVSCRIVRVRYWGVVGVVFLFSVFASTARGHGPCWEGLGNGEV